MSRAAQICTEPGCPETATYRGRCIEHARQQGRRERATVPTKRDEPRSRVRRRAAVAQWRATHGNICPGHKRPPHPASDLTAQHGHALAEGGSAAQPLTVLCRSCNSRHAAELTT